MTDTKLLKLKMLAAGDDHFTDALVVLLGVSKPTANNKLNGKIPFGQTQIAKIADRYELSNDEICSIFFGR